MSDAENIEKATKYMDLLRISSIVLFAIAAPIVGTYKMNESLAEKITEIKINYVTKERLDKTTTSFIKVFEKLNTTIGANTQALSRLQGYMEAKRER